MSAATRGSFWCLHLLAALCAAAVAGATVSQDDDADVRALAVEALERMDEELRKVAGDFRALVTIEVWELDGSGEVAWGNRVEWESIPIDGARFSRRLAIDGRPLTGEEPARENEREAAFRLTLGRWKPGAIEREQDPFGIVIDEEYFDRSDLILESEEPFRNRPSYRIAFAPRDGDLPVRGRIWVDRETHELARLEFEQIGRIRMAWGLVATIHHVRGSLDRGPVLDGIWATLQEETYTDHRSLFSGRKRVQTLERWRDYAWTEEPAPQDASTAANPDAADGGALRRGGGILNDR